tara:strand:+ start:571 stop:1005 length:435 start_codon:yes stop_codon:yes gene_type:complete
MTRPILERLLNEWTPEYINPNKSIIYPDFSNDKSINSLWLQRCYEDNNDIHNKKIILMGKSIGIEETDWGDWYAVCIYDELKEIYKFRSLLKWNNKPNVYKDKKMKQSLDNEYWIDYSNMDYFNEWWIELKKRICKNNKYRYYS